MVRTKARRPLIPRSRNKRRNNKRNSILDKNLQKILKNYDLKKEQLKEINSRNEILKKEYENVEPIVKIWISQHERIKSNNNLQNTLQNNLQNSLKLLPLDVKYEIIYFIPTNIKDNISINLKINTLIKENNFTENQSNEIYNSMKFLLEPNSLKEECKFIIDDPMITFHKMRLINKEFNLKMKLKLLNLSHLNFDVIFEREIRYNYKELRRIKNKYKKQDEYGQLWNLLTLLRNQTLYYNYCNNLSIEEKEEEMEEKEIENKEKNNLLIQSILHINHVTLYDVIEEELGIKQEDNDDMNSNNTVTVLMSKNNHLKQQEMNNLMEVMEMENKEEKMLTTETVAVTENELEIFNMTEEQLNELEEQIIRTSNNKNQQKEINNNNGQELIKPIQKKQTIYKERDYAYTGLSINRYLINNFDNEDNYEDEENEDNEILTPSLGRYVGKNRTIKSIQLNYDLFRVSQFIGNIRLLVVCLKELTTLNLINYNGHGLLPSSPLIKHINFINLNCDGIYQQLGFIPDKLVLFKNLETINIFPITNKTVNEEMNDEEEEMIEEAFNLQTYLEELSKDIPEDTSIVFIEKKLNNTNDEETVLYTVENENSIKSIELTLAFSKNFTQNNWKELIQHYLFYIKHKPFDWIFTKNEISLTMKKWILEYLIVNNYLLVENLSLMEMDFEKDYENKCLVQYLIYLSNEYQNGKLFNLKKTIRYKEFTDIRSLNFIKFINYGYYYENQIIDLFYYLLQNQFPIEISTFLLQHLVINNNNEENIMNELFYFLSYYCHHAVSHKSEYSFIIEYFIQFIFKQYGTCFMKKLLMKNVINIYATYNNSVYVELPLIIKLSTILEPYLLLELINLFTNEEILSINVNGNNICQAYIKVFPKIDNQFIIKLIEKVPELLHTKNNLQQTILHTCCISSIDKQIELANYLIKQYNLNCNIPDNEGRTAKELLELRKPLLAQIIFGATATNE
ncbi:hypothetical protein ABK040_007030 [Willaertia magna]